MRERPILFSAPMIRAILAGSKSQTRRVLKLPHVEDIGVFAYDAAQGLWEGGVYGDGGAVAHGAFVRCPYGAPGDRLWVRETWSARVDGAPVGDEIDAVFVRYDADGTEQRFDETVMGIEWTLPLAARKARAPSIHMPRWASRITLEITDVRVERLQAITEEDARAEGAKRASVRDGLALTSKHGECLNGNHRDGFRVVWDSLNGAKSPWSANAWVWALTFKRVTP